MPYKLAIFDFDGTLADSFPWFATVINDTADKFRFRRIAPHEIDDLRGKSSREMMQLLGVSAWKLPFIARYIRKRKAQDLHAIPLFAEAPVALRRLSEAGVTLAMVSSNSEANIRKMFGSETAALIAHYECGSSLHGKAKRFRPCCAKAALCQRRRSRSATNCATSTRRARRASPSARSPGAIPTVRRCGRRSRTSSSTRSMR
jgi:phosphoglycolate phosphatase